MAASTAALRNLANVALLLLCVCACTAVAWAAPLDAPIAAGPGTDVSFSAFVNVTAQLPATGIPLRPVPAQAWQALESRQQRMDAGSAGRVQMRTLADVSGALPAFNVRSFGPSTASTMSIGYWLQVTAGANVNVYLIGDADYPKVLNGESFSYYTTYSFQDVNTAYLPTNNVGGLTEPVRLVIYGAGYAATTIKGIVNVRTATCVSSTPCQNQGLCTGLGQCDCPPNGWSGATCGTAICSAVTCNERQDCTAPDVCSCKAGWSGTACGTPVCSQGCTTGQGSCTAPDVCTCASGFSGSSCSGVNGGYTAFSGAGAACLPTHSRSEACIRTETRTCTAPTPSNGGLDCSAIGPATREVSCTCPPIHGGYTAWGAFGVCAGLPVCSQSRSRTCTNPEPARGGADCSVLGPAFDARPCTSCRSSGAPLLGTAVITTDSAQMKELASSQGWKTEAEWESSRPASDPSMYDDVVTWRIACFVAVPTLLFMLIVVALVYQRRMQKWSRIQVYSVQAPAAAEAEAAEAAQAEGAAGPQVQMSSLAGHYPTFPSADGVPHAQQQKAFHAFSVPTEETHGSPVFMHVEPVQV